MKKQSIDDIQKELAKLQPKQTSTNNPTQAQPTEKTPDYDDPAFYEDLTKWPMSSDEKREFDKLIAIANRRSYGLYSDPDPDDPDSWLKLHRLVRYGLLSERRTQ